jgi:NAD(P)-dependent dehydrogenase (short-subunit alcohol dehydrogenase family)
MATALLAPAQTLTTLHNFSFDDAALPDSATPTQGRDGNTLKGVSPVSRIGEVKEVVDEALLLTDATFTSGEILHVDGGARAGEW